MEKKISNNLRIFNAIYQDRKDKIKLICKDDAGKFLQFVDPEWFFYIDFASLEKLNKLAPIETIKNKFKIKKFKIKKPYVRVYTSYLDKDLIINYLNSLNIPVYEDNVNPVRRFLVSSDLDIQIEQNYKILYLDIETDDRPNANGNKEIIVGEKQIISIAGYHSESENFVICKDNEIELLIEALTRIKNYDIIVGWNSKSFDLPYIKLRIEKYYKENGIDIYKLADFDWDQVIHVDLMWRFKNVFQTDQNLTSFSLKRVSEYFGVGSKTDLHNKGTWELFVSDRGLLTEYNLNDCRLLYKLEEKLKIIEYMITMAQYAKITLNDFYITEILNSLFLIYSEKNRIHIKLNSNYNSEKKDYVGGHVLEPNIGLHENVVIFDFSSLYPNIIKSWNISPETLIRTKQDGSIESCKSNIYFKKKPGLLPIMVTDLLNEREKFKKLKKELPKDSIDYYNADRNEKIVKELNNSVYGTTANPRSYFYNIDLAESITLAGQYLIKFCSSYLDSKGYKVVSGDTDSVMFSIPKEVDYMQVLNELNSAIEVELKSKFNLDQVTVKLKYEKRFSKFIVVRKKNYVGRLIDEGGTAKDVIYAKGLELIKKDTIKLTKKLLEEVIHELLYNSRDLNFFIKYIEDLWENIYHLTPSLDDIRIIKKISKSPSEYKSIPPHVRVIMNSDKNKDQFFNGMDINYIVENFKDKKFILAENFSGIWDIQYYWEHLVYPPIKRILAVVFKDHPWDKYSEAKYIEKTRKNRRTKNRI